jgi:1-acyl-sn-glycerol-3-phosphate acyltransferase
MAADEGVLEREDRAPEVSPLLISVFGRYTEKTLARHFRALRLSKSQRPDLVAARGKPLIVYFNHPSWWDPLVCAQLAAKLLPDRRHYAPLDTDTFGRDPFFARVGFFAIEPGTSRGARRFLAISQDILKRPDAALWLAAEGRSADPRERPVQLRSGISHLAARLRSAVLLPLAIEYPFWEERLPEALARFGEEIPAGDADLDPGDWTPILESRLESALEELAAESLARDASRFEVLLQGGASGGVFQVWRRLKGRLARD